MLRLIVMNEATFESIISSTQEQKCVKFEWASSNLEHMKPSEADFTTLTHDDKALIMEMIGRKTSTAMLRHCSYKFRCDKIEDEILRIKPKDFSDFGKKLALSLLVHVTRCEMGFVQIDNIKKLNLQNLQELALLEERNPAKLFVSARAQKSWYEMRYLDIVFAFYDTPEGQQKLIINSAEKGILMRKIGGFSSEAIGYYNLNYKNSFDLARSKARDSIEKAGDNIDPAVEKEKMIKIITWFNTILLEFSRPKNQTILSKISGYNAKAYLLVPKGAVNPRLVSARQTFLRVSSDYKKYGQQPLINIPYPTKD